MDSSASTILVSCKQTRFHIEAPVYQELDIEGLTITVTSAGANSETKKGKARSEGLEILSNATLKLKPGIHYALVGRNGTGKSTLLRAIAEKLIPGIPLATRIAILQQTAAGKKEDSTEPFVEGSRASTPTPTNRTVIEEVVERAIARNNIQREIDILSSAIDGGGDAFASLRAIRHVRHERLKRELYELDKNARLRSGTRGMQARKMLTAFEKKVEESEARLKQPETEIDSTELNEETEAALSMLTDLQAQIEPTRLAEIEVRARAILTGLGFPKANFDKPVSSLSGGWRMRCNLASALLSETDILILDEPTNFLDLLGILWLQRHLLDLRGSSPTTLLLVSHDRDFIDTTTQETIILRDQTLTYFRGNYTAWEADVKSKQLYFGRMKDAQDRQRAHMEKTVAQNMKQGREAGDQNKVRQAVSRKKKLDDRMGLEVSAKGTRFKLNRDLLGWHLQSRAGIDVPTDERGVSMSLPEAPDLRFPGPLISLQGVTFRYPSAPKTSKPILDDIDLVIHMGERIGVVGLNGCGKSTLIKLVTELTKPTKGTFTKHPRLRLGYYSQHAVEELQAKGMADESLTALSLLTKDVEGELDEGELRSLLGSLGLPGRTASDVPVAKLSGGQLVRLALAMILWRSPQLLVLDEITTHLDFYTVTALCNALAEWNGAILLVSHDRFMVRRVVEGEKPEEGSDDEGAPPNDEEEVARRRDVFLLKGGKLIKQNAGVSSFEQSLEKRIEKLSLS